MKCIYYLAPTLSSTSSISKDLHDIGINDWFLHVISKDEAGLKKEKIHSSNYIETMDFMRCGLIGANIGFVIGMILAGLVMFFQPFGADIPGIIYVVIGAIFTMMGAWEGGLYGVDSENTKLAGFHDDIEEGKYLILIYAYQNQVESIHRMMREQHAESEHVATDNHYMSPLSLVRRKHNKASHQDQVVSE